MSDERGRSAGDGLDRAIDAVARDMVRAEAPAAMRAAVLDRLEARPAYGRLAALHRPAVYAAMAAGVAAVIGIWVSLPLVRERPQRQEAAVRDVAGPPAALAGSDTPNALAEAETTLAATEPGSPAAGAVRWTVDRPRRPRPAANPAELPRLAVVEPLAVDPLAPDPLVFDDIRVAPMADVQALEIPGLDEVLPDRDPAGPDRKER